MRAKFVNFAFDFYAAEITEMKFDLKVSVFSAAENLNMKSVNFDSAPCTLHSHSGQLYYSDPYLEILRS